MNKNDKLTLIVYMAADNDLESYAMENLKQMELSNFSRINVLALVDRAEGYDETDGNWTDTRFYKISHDRTNGSNLVSKRLDCPALGISSESETELNMGNYQVLKNLVRYVESQYKTEKYALIIWGHGTGWRNSVIAEKSLAGESSVRAVAIDDKTGSYISVSELGKALENSSLSVIGFDTCFGGVIENIYELRNCADLTVASPGVTPAGGWKYREMLEKLSASDFSSDSIAEIFMTASNASATKFKNEKIENLVASFDDFCMELSIRIGSSMGRNEVFNSFRELKSYYSSSIPSELYLDLYSIAELYTDSEDDELARKASKVCSAIKLAAVTNKNENPEIGIYFADRNSTSTVSPTHPADYVKTLAKLDQCAFIKNTQWWAPTEKHDCSSLLDILFYQADD